MNNLRSDKETSDSASLIAEKSLYHFAASLNINIPSACKSNLSRCHATETSNTYVRPIHPASFLHRACMYHGLCFSSYRFSWNYQNDARPAATKYSFSAVLYCDQFWNHFFRSFSLTAIVWRTNNILTLGRKFGERGMLWVNMSILPGD